MPPHASRDFAAVRPLGFCGYADLLIAQAGGGVEAMAALAALLGYQHTGPRPPRDQPVESKPDGNQPVEDAGPPEFTAAPLANAAFWRLEQRTFLTATEPPKPAVATVAWEGLPPRRTKTAPLARWSALVPHLRAGCAKLVEAKDPDVRAMLRLLERGQRLHRLPRHRRRRWGSRVQIIIDRSERLTPFFDDQDGNGYALEARLKQLFPRHAAERVAYVGGCDSLCAFDRLGRAIPFRLPDAGTLVIVLGDLGAAWRATRPRLWRAGSHLADASPAPVAAPSR